jgi:hypothetical protein
MLDGYMHHFVAIYALLGDALFFGVHFVISNFFLRSAFFPQLFYVLPCYGFSLYLLANFIVCIISFPMHFFAL